MVNPLIEFDQQIRLQTVISGGQTGADQAGLFAAYECGIETGGYAPFGFKTSIGNNAALLKDKFNLIEHSSRDYSLRTALNVKMSDATVRLATNFNTAGELCTMKAIRRYEKPFIDIDLNHIGEQYINESAEALLKFLAVNNILVLNIAGNADRFPNDGFGIHFHSAKRILVDVFSRVHN